VKLEKGYIAVACHSAGCVVAVAFFRDFCILVAGLCNSIRLGISAVVKSLVAETEQFCVLQQIFI